MTLSNDELVRRFVDGETSGKCNRIAISAFEGHTFLWGFGHALYAIRRQDDGLMVVYDGWNDYSQTTSTHMNKVSGKAKGRYGEPTNDGHQIRATVDGEGGAEIVQAPPKGHVLLVVDEAPDKNYGKLDAEGRPELSEFDGRHVPSPDGASSR